MLIANARILIYNKNNNNNIIIISMLIDNFLLASKYQKFT